ncbi:hypothetical protein [Paracoccus sp. IB05]|uniref:hypothetical protein n=1 Tax=Paracoccus sp. IB05 TaxID=2779367 RepID=UPI0018E7D1A9|nr:hypothetical protein [Paracoccus sp. IB05]MBJ2152472.1 hypothetical protein [Paracoccus sp. IB05]
MGLFPYLFKLTVLRASCASCSQINVLQVQSKPCASKPAMQFLHASGHKFAMIHPGLMLHVQHPVGGMAPGVAFSPETGSLRGNSRQKERDWRMFSFRASTVEKQKEGSHARNRH